MQKKVKHLLTRFFWNAQNIPGSSNPKKYYIYLRLSFTNTRSWYMPRPSLVQ